MAGEGVFPKSDGDIVFASDFNRVNLVTATATISSDSTTTSSTYADSTLTVTLSGLTAAETYTFFAIATFEGSNSSDQAFFKLVIGSTDMNEVRMAGTDHNSGQAVHGLLTGQTGITSIIAKVQIKNNNDSSTIGIRGGGSRDQRITIIGLPE